MGFLTTDQPLRIPGHLGPNALRGRMPVSGEIREAGLATNPFESLALAFGNMSAGDVSSTAKGLLSPDSLSPAQRRTITERMTSGKDDGFFAGLLDTVTNPMVLGGLILALAYPIGSAAQVMRIGSRIKAYAARSLPGIRHLSDFRALYPGRLTTWFDHVVAQNHAWGEMWSHTANKSIDGFIKAGGKWDENLWMRMGVNMGGLHKADHRAWQFLRAQGGRAGRSALPRGYSPLSHLEMTDPRELKLLESFRNVTDGQFLAVMNAGASDPKVSKRLLAQLNNMGVEAKHLGAKLDDYFPQVELMDRAQLDKLHTEWLADFAQEGQAYRQFAATSPLRQVSKSLAPRSGVMLPNRGHLEKLGVWSDDLAGAYEAATNALRTKAGNPLMLIREYGLAAPQTLMHYTRGMARTMAWSMPPTIHGIGKSAKSAGQLIMEELPLVAQGSPEKAALLRDTYIPLATGHLAWRQVMPSLMFADLRAKSAAAIRAFPGLSKDLKDRLIKPMAEGSGLSWNTMGHRVTDYFYSTTLAWNVISPVKNLFQHLLGTIPTAGPKYFAEGVEEVLAGKARQAAFMRKGMPRQEALAKAFPEFSNTGLGVSLTSERGQLMEQLERGVGVEIGATTKTRRGLEAFNRTGLRLFEETEQFNRLAAFYTWRKKGLKELVGQTIDHPWTGEALKVTAANVGEMADSLATKMTYVTQYGGGPLSLPSGIATLNPAFRQYMMFPGRTLGMLTDAGTSLYGEGARNFGTLGRMALTSGLAYGAAKNLGGEDISSALMWGALPEMGNSSSPFGIVPLVPPAAQVAGSVVSAAVQGDIDVLLRQVPTVVPGGIQISRALPKFAPELSKSLGRTYADYERQLPDGRTPMYSSEGGLIGYYNPLQMWIKAIGLSSFTKEKEGVVQRYLLKAREPMRALRRDAAESLANSDMEGFNQADAEWRKMFPGLGPLQLKKSDIRAVHTRRFIARLERVMQSMPKDVRPAFAQAISVSLGAEAEKLLGVDPMLLGNYTPRQMDAHRPQVLQQQGAPASPNWATQYGSSSVRSGADNTFYGGY